MNKTQNVDGMQNPGLYIERLSSGLEIEMIYVEGGSFMMGGDDAEAWDREKPIHEVKLQSFYLGKYLVTQSLWESVMGNNPSKFKGEEFPVEEVSWNDCQNFLKKLNQITGKTYRLPSESEWEFAARGGVHSEGYLYSGSDWLKEVGWYDENSDNKTHSVGQKLGNELGIYEMSGNVWEWVEDQWHDDYEGAPVDGSAWVDRGSGAYRVLRSGSWDASGEYCRASVRDYDSPEFRSNNIGFRLALSLQSAG